MNNQNLLLRILPILIIGLALSAFAYLKSSKPDRKQPVASEKIWQVEVSKAELLSLSPGLTLYGQVETHALLNAAAPGPGLVSEVLVRPGDLVQRGQRLLVMDRRDFTSANLQANADVSDLQAQLTELDLKYQANKKSVAQENNLLKLAKTEVTRIERLKQNNLTSESALSDAREIMGKQELSLISKQLEVDRYQSSQRQLQARLARARAKLVETELAIERSEIVASFDGVVSQVRVAAGDRAKISDVLLSLYPVDSLEIRARIPARYQTETQQALREGKHLMAHADTAGQKLELELLRLAGEADPSGIDAYFKVLDGSSQLRIGNLLKIELERPLQNNVITVPFRAIYGNNRLYLHKEGRMSAVDVESIGQYDAQSDTPLLLIRSSLIESGDEIITTHLPNAVDGLKVKIVADG